MSLNSEHGTIFANVEIELRSKLELGWWQSRGAVQDAIIDSPLIETKEDGEKMSVRAFFNSSGTIETMCSVFHQFLKTMRPIGSKIMFEFAIHFGKMGEFKNRKFAGGVAVVDAFGWEVTTTTDIIDQIESGQAH